MCNQVSHVSLTIRVKLTLNWNKRHLLSSFMFLISSNTQIGNKNFRNRPDTSDSSIRVYHWTKHSQASQRYIRYIYRVQQNKCSYKILKYQNEENLVNIKFVFILLSSLTFHNRWKCLNDIRHHDRHLKRDNTNTCIKLLQQGFRNVKLLLLEISEFIFQKFKWQNI